MKTEIVTLAFGVVLLCACSSSPPDQSAGGGTPTATVQVMTLALDTLTEEITVYGRITSGPAGRQTLSVPYESRVAQILVRPGQEIAAGTPVMEVDPSPDTQLTVQQARATVESTHETLDAVRQQFHLQLATNQQFEAAEQAARTAELQLASLSRRGSTRTRQLVASGPAVVASVRVSEGSIAAPGSPLIELDLRQHREAVFGMEVEDVHRVSPGIEVTVADLALPPLVTTEGEVRATADVVNPETHLVDLFATLPAAVPLILGQPVTGTLEITSAPALIVPRSALLPVEDHLVVFTVVDNHAVAHTVQTGVETDAEVELVSSDLNEGDDVVISGVSVLEDGMAVRVEQSS